MNVTSHLLLLGMSTSLVVMASCGSGPQYYAEEDVEILRQVDKPDKSQIFFKVKRDPIYYAPGLVVVGETESRIKVRFPRANVSDEIHIPNLYKAKFQTNVGVYVELENPNNKSIQVVGGPD